jgi:quercetin dioxygenase-like cupin family protein
MQKTLELPDGATVEYLTPVEDGAPCVMRGTIPAGGVVPLHSHADPETFIVLEGEALSFTGGDWELFEAGDVHHIPGRVRHAWRNHTTRAVVMYLVSTATMARFFQEVAGASPEEFLAISDRYGYWNATPDENADVGLQITASG